MVVLLHLFCPLFGCGQGVDSAYGDDTPRSTHARLGVDTGTHPDFYTEGGSVGRGSPATYVSEHAGGGHQYYAMNPQAQYREEEYGSGEAEAEAEAGEEDGQGDSVSVGEYLQEGAADEGGQASSPATAMESFRRQLYRAMLTITAQARRIEQQEALLNQVHETIREVHSHLADKVSV